MTRTAVPPLDGGGRGAVWWLTAQSVAFGFTAALVGVVANAMFLDRYGARWLPVTYILVAAAGVAVSAGIARASRRFDLVPIAVTVLGSITAVFASAWLLGGDGDAPWVSGPLLVVFAILIGLGFVFVGMQAGRILDIAGIKARLPRIMAGFPVGAIAGGLAGGPLVTWTGRTEGLLLPTAVAQATFTALVWGTGHRYADRLARPTPRPMPASPGDGERPGIGRLLANRFVLLVLGYQVLSSLGSQIADYLVMDRAAARFPDSEDLARFVSAYTAVMNTAIILFLVVLAGPLMRRYGLRLGIGANPVVVTALAVVMVVVLVGSGGGSVALLFTVSAARILDLVLDDGMTRTSVNALFQVLPPSARVEAQAVVEGMGVPVAIGLSGVVIILVNLLPTPLPVTIAVMVLVCAAWSWTAFALHRAYRPALVDALRRRPVLDADARVARSAEELASARRLANRREAGAVRLALDVVAGMDSPAPLPELHDLTRDPRAEVRLAALGGLAERGDEKARVRLAEEAEAAVTSADPQVRARVASVLPEVGAPHRAPLLALLLADSDPRVRAAALAVVSGHDGVEVALEAALAGLGDPAMVSAAVGAVSRLGDAAVPALGAALASSQAHTQPWVRRLVVAVAPSPARDRVLARHADHEDLLVGLTVLEALAGAQAAEGPVAAACDEVTRTDIDAAARLSAVEVAVEGALTDDIADRALRRALADEQALRRSRCAAALAVRHGTAGLADALAVLRTGDPEVGVAVEAVEIAVGPASSGQVVAVLDPRLGPGERLERLRATGAQAAALRGPAEAVRSLVEAPPAHKVSAWLRACAVAAAAAHGWLPAYDLREAGRAGDPALAEQLALSGGR